MIVRKVHGWILDLPDQRDYLYSAIRPKIRLPKQVDLTRFCSTVEAQGVLGSCTACAMAGNLEFLDNKPDRKYTDVSRLFIHSRPENRTLQGADEQWPLSISLQETASPLAGRSFIYYNERALRGNEDHDSGASLRDGIKTLKKG